MQLENEYALEFDPEELKRMSRILAQTLLEQVRSEDDEAQFTLITCVSGYEVIREDQITEVVNLDLIASSTAGVLDPLGQLKDWFTSIINSISSWIVSSIESFIDTYVTPTIDMISGNVSAIISDLANIPSLVVSAITQEFPSLISDITDSVVSSIETVVLDPIRSFVDWVSAQFEALTPIADAIMAGITDALNFLGSLSATLQNTFTSLIDQISSTLSSLSSSLTTVFSDLTTAVTATFDSLMSNLMSSITSITDTIMSSLSTIPSTISELINSITATFDSLISDLTDLVYSLSDTINTSLSAIPDTIYSIIDSILADLTTTQGLINSIIASLSAIPETVESATAELAEVQKAISGFVDLLIDLPVKAPEIVYSVASAIWQQQIAPLFETINVTIIEPLKASVSDVVINVSSGFQQITQVIAGFTNSILHFPEWFPAWFEQYISKPITDALNIQILINPIEWIKTSLEPAVRDLISPLWSYITGAVDWLLDILSKAVGGLWESMVNLGRAVVTEISKTVEGITSFCSELAENISGAIYSPVINLIQTSFSLIEKGMEEIYGRILKGEGRGEWLELSGLFLLLVSSQFTFRMMSQLLMWIGEHTEFKIFPNVAIKVFSGGAEQTIEIPLKFGSVLKHLAHEFREYPDTLMRGFIYGVSIWYSQPIARLFNYLWRNRIPIELPPIGDILEYTRRMLPLGESFQKLWEESKTFMGLYGYSDTVIRQYLAKADELYLTVKDRFGAERKIPLSLMYELPSASDVATMMVRDIFPSIEEFQKLYLARGMTSDIGALYYFLRYKYPPPERLWQFVTRGISGVLWATLTTDELDEIKKEAEAVGAPVPISPAELNFKANELFNAFKTYMKWHDYARFSWIQDFTSDNLIYIDTLADIPTKIDQRWITKWGLYELLSSKGVELSSPISEFRTKIIEDRAKSNVTMDLTLFARTLQATGMHPDWIPITTVAEAINALADERTLLRTGFINLFKEGFWDTKSLEMLLAGVIMASFKVSYFDTTKMQWGTGWINHPVMFLPAERKLLELRALMDRALDILRDTVRDISRGYSEWIIKDYEEFKEKLTSIINKINEFFAEDYKEITGVELPDELKLQFVEAYYKPYIASLDIWKDIYTIRRVRYWTQRWLGWIMYRVATGVVKREDIQAFATYVGEKAKLTPYETEFIQGVLERLTGITQREYIPTPSQLATLSEYLVIDKEMINKVFEARRVPEEWQSIWQKYITVRPIKPDFKSLITVARRALRYDAITEEEWENILTEALKYGFTKTEIEILERIAELEETIETARENRREYIPTPYSLATICEYIPKAREFFDEVMKARHVPKEWIPIWADYVDFKPLINEVRKMISRAEDLYVYFMITEEDFKKVLDQVKFLGYTEKEIEYMLTNARYERHYRAWRELIGDVDRMTMLAEYSPEARSFALGQLNKMIDALPIEEETKAVLKKMWEQFIRLKPVMDEVRRYVTELISDFVEGIITEEEFVSELEELRKWGLDDYEIMFYKAIAGMRKARYLKRRQRTAY